MLSKMKIEEIIYEKKTKSGFNLDSFERFGDDLCQLLLSFLPISDKIKFECVSKQWKYLIFNKQRKLIINGTKTIDTMPISLKFMEKNSNSIIEKLTKKLIFLKELRMNLFIDQQMLETIAKNCQFLRKINSFGSNVEIEKHYKTFGQICGQKLQHIDFYTINEKELLSLLESTHNLKSIKVFNNLEAVVK
jgi:hypothetical protein